MVHCRWLGGFNALHVDDANSRSLPVGAVHRLAFSTRCAPIQQRSNRRFFDLSPVQPGAFSCFVSLQTFYLRQLRPNGLNRNSAAVDLVTTPGDVLGLYRLQAQTIHGVLWLQTHFPASEWDALLHDQACFSGDCLDNLLADALKAGLLVNQPVAA